MPRIEFKDYPDFKPNLTPKQIFEMGSFGGTFWRPIQSGALNKKLKNEHLKYPESWWIKLPENYLTNRWDKYDKYINKYKVKVGSPIESWESKKWITIYHPYGWVHWYCDFYMGHRCPDDSFQINLWKNFAGPNSKVKSKLIKEIKEKNGKYDDFSINPVYRQILQHWAYKLTEKDLKNQ